jgi:hypothetical protein
MIRPEPADVTNQPDRANIERIVEYLERLSDGVFGLVPGDALDAIMGLLVRAEVAERQLAQDERRSSEVRSEARQRREKEISYVCRICGRSVELVQRAGAFRPSVCATEWCRREARQQDARERQRRLRGRRHIERGGKSD